MHRLCVAASLSCGLAAIAVVGCIDLGGLSGAETDAGSDALDALDALDAPDVRADEQDGAGDAGGHDADSGLPAPDGGDAGPDAATCGSVPLCTRTVFVTSLSYTGAMGGLVGADAKCQALADAPGSKVRGKKFKAWVSSATVSASARLVQGTAPYVRVDGVGIAATFADLTDGMLGVALNIDELGALRSDASVWTGTRADGVRAPTNCTGFTSSSAAVTGATGNSSNADGFWTNLEGAACSGLSGLYCIEE